MPVITQKEYKSLLSRQIRVEKELEAVKKFVRVRLDEEQISPAKLKHWEDTSRDLDHGKGRSFTSQKKMEDWLKNL